MENSVNLAFVSFEKLIIPFSSLDKGISTFEFTTIRPDLHGEENCLFPHEIHIIAQVTTLGDDFLVDLRVWSEGKLLCDRCGAEFQTVVEGGVKTLFTFEDVKTSRDEWDDVKVLSPGDEGIDISQDAWDAISLATPTKRLCEEACRGLCGHCGANLNIESCSCKENDSDPRWDALKNLTFDDE